MTRHAPTFAESRRRDGRAYPPAFRGVTLIDVLVALVIAMLTLVVAYRTLVVMQAISRSVAAAADTHATAAFVLQILAIAAAGAGAGITQEAATFDTCPASSDLATALRPVTLLITDGGSADRPDKLEVRRSAAGAALAARLVSDTSPGAPFEIEAVDGWASGDRFVATSRAGQCASAEVSGVAPTAPGRKAIAHTSVDIALPTSSLLLNLGAARRGATIRYDVAAGVLRSTDVSNGDAPTPIASNIANVKLQYGIDSDGDGALDTWVTATGAWSPANILVAPWSTLARIMAVRIGVIARTEFVDRTRAGDFHWVLFDCERDDKTACPGRLEGTIAPTSSGAYRYRAIETVVPLRNVLWRRGG